VSQLFIITVDILLQYVEERAGAPTFQSVSNRTLCQ